MIKFKFEDSPLKDNTNLHFWPFYDFVIPTPYVRLENDNLRHYQLWSNCQPDEAMPNLIQRWKLYRKQATNRAHLTSMFYFLRWVPRFSKFGIWIELMAHLILVLKCKMEILIEKSWPFHSCLYNCIGHWRLTTLTTNRAQSMFNQLLLHTLKNPTCFELLITISTHIKRTISFLKQRRSQFNTMTPRTLNPVIKKDWHPTILLTMLPFFNEIDIVCD